MSTYTDGHAPPVSSGPPEPGGDVRPTDGVRDAEAGMPRQSLGVEDSGPAWVNAEIQRRMREAASRPGGRHARRERGEASDDEQPEPQQAAAPPAESRETPPAPVEAGERQWPPARPAAHPRVRTAGSPNPYSSDGGARHAESPPAGSRPVAPPPAPAAAAFVAQRGDDVTTEHPRVDERAAPGPRYAEDAPDYDDEYDGGFVATEDDEDDSQILWSANAGPAADLADVTPPPPGAPAKDDDPYADYLSVADGVSAVEQTMPYPATGQIDHASGRVRVVLSERRQNQRSVRTVQDVQDLTSVGDLLRSNLIGNQLGLALRVAAVAVLTLGSLPALFALFPEIGQVDILGLRLPWLLLGVLVYPFLLLLGWWHTRSAEKVEQEFADHVQD